ncbi:DUF1697 domain-containing protein [Roseateles paludis]|uniref:DUF1697 domain-containing protein n=1 Tax=Roseateles paludis TaxID=3145238 RepID=A0ABV0G2M8_9BURK
MPRYVALLRGVSPMNARSPDLQRCFEAAGFSDVRTLLSSGNVVFNARTTSCAGLERRAEAAMQSTLDRVFDTFVRPAEFLRELVASEPFAEFKLPPAAKPVVTFLRRPSAHTLALPIERDDACVLKFTGSEVLSFYVPGPKASAFMAFLERSFSKDITTRTLETVRKCSVA